MTLTRTEDKTDKAITRLLMQSPLGLTIGDITAAAKCTPQTARKSLARIGADKDASGMLYVLRDDDEQAAPEPEQAAPAPAPEQPSLMVRMQRAQTQDELDIIASEIDMADPEIRADLNKIYVQESERLNQLPL